jgi:hypothetical protein
MSDSLYNSNSMGRLPVVPLSYEFKDFAKIRELVVNYTTGDVYVKTDSGELVNICASISTMEKFAEYLKTNSDIVSDLTVTTPDGAQDTVENVLNTFYSRIEDLNNKSYLYAGSDTDGGSAKSANRLNNSLTIQEDNGNTVFDGSSDKSVDLTEYYKNTGGEITGDVTLGDVLILSKNIMYGTELPATGSEGQLFFLIVD